MQHHAIDVGNLYAPGVDTYQGISKVERYSWVIKDKVGTFAMLHKKALSVDPDYQRHPSEKKIKALATNWSWVGCGVICVAKRGDKHYVLDGQHRVLAALRRSDIDDLPCMVFDCPEILDEAKGFMDANFNRRALDGFDKFRAMLVMGYPPAIVVQGLLDKHGLTLMKIKAGEGKEIKCIATLLSHANDVEKLDLTLGLCAELCPHDPILKTLVGGLCYILKNLTGTPDLNRFSDRVLSLSRGELLDAAHRSAVYYNKGKDRTWAVGMLDEINKGLRNKFTMSSLDG